MTDQGKIKGKSRRDQRGFKGCTSTKPRLRRRPPPPSEARRRKKKEEAQIGPRRIGVRGGGIDHKADDRPDLVIAPQNVNVVQFDQSSKRGDKGFQ